MSRAKVARELGLNVNMLARWVRRAKSGKWEMAPGRPLKTEQQQEIERLRRELKRADRARHPKKGGGLLREGTLVRYGFVARHQAIWPVRTMCRMLAVSHGGFYEWRARGPSRRGVENALLISAPH